MQNTRTRNQKSNGCQCANVATIYTSIAIFKHACVIQLQVSFFEDPGTGINATLWSKLVVKLMLKVAIHMTIYHESPL